MNQATARPTATVGPTLRPVRLKPGVGGDGGRSGRRPEAVRLDWMLDGGFVAVGRGWTPPAADDADRGSLRPRLLLPYPYLLCSRSTETRTRRWRAERRAGGVRGITTTAIAIIEAKTSYRIDSRLKMCLENVNQKMLGFEVETYVGLTEKGAALGTSLALHNPAMKGLTKRPKIVVHERELTEP